MQDLSLAIDGGTLNLRSAGIILKGNRILLTKHGDRYTFLGGKIQGFESSKDTLVREIKEELGYSSKVGDLLFVHEHFYGSDENKCHEICFYYQVFIDDPAVTISDDFYNREGREVIWLPLEQTRNINLQPLRVRNQLLSLPEHAMHFCTYED